jgi:hypothetical protein
MFGSHGEYKLTGVLGILFFGANLGILKAVKRPEVLQLPHLAILPPPPSISKQSIERYSLPLSYYWLHLTGKSIPMVLYIFHMRSNDDYEYHWRPARYVHSPLQGWLDDSHKNLYIDYTRVRLKRGRICPRCAMYVANRCIELCYVCSQ